MYLSLLLLALALPLRAAETPAAAPTASASALPPSHEVCVIIGAPGDETYAPGFTTAAKNWETACQQAGATCTVLGLAPEGDKIATDHDQLQAWIAKLDPVSGPPVWIAYVGHGTFDGREARMNLRGPDVTPAELAAWLKPVTRPVIFIHGGSASEPFLAALSGPNRVIITATQNSREINYCRFGERFAAALTDPASDLDQDGQISLLEAFVTASQQTQTFYKENGRMASEHAMIDDNGDKRGTPAEWFAGTRLTKHPADGVVADGARARLITLKVSDAERTMTAAQFQLRDQCENQLEQLKAGKSDMSDADYYAALEPILRQLATVYVPPPPAATPAQPAPP